MELKVKDFAAMQGVSDSIIYRHIRQHKEALGDRVVKKGKATWLTEEGQEYIRGLMIQQPIVVGDAGAHQKYEDLLEENRNILKALNMAKDRIIELQGAQAQLEAAQQTRLLLEESRDEYRKQAENAVQEASEARERAITLENEKKALEAEIEALKKRSWWDVLTRKGV